MTREIGVRCLGRSLAEKATADETLTTEQPAAGFVFSASGVLSDSASHVDRVALVATELPYLSSSVTILAWL